MWSLDGFAVEWGLICGWRFAHVGTMHEWRRSVHGYNGRIEGCRERVVVMLSGDYRSEAFHACATCRIA